MHPHRTSAPAHEHPTPPPMAPALAFYAAAYFATGVRYSPRLHRLLTARIRTFGAETVAAQAREVCARVAAGEQDA